MNAQHAPKILTPFDHVITIDPNGKFPAAPANRLIEACGLLLPWACKADPENYIEGDSLPDTIDCSYKARLLHEYPYYMGHDMGGTVDPQTGAYSYPGDPDLYPLVRVEHAEIPEILYIYQYGIIAVCNEHTNEPAFVTRMD